MKIDEPPPMSLMLDLICIISLIKDFIEKNARN